MSIEKPTKIIDLKTKRKEKNREIAEQEIKDTINNPNVFLKNLDRISKCTKEIPSNYVFEENAILQDALGQYGFTKDEIPTIVALISMLDNMENDEPIFKILYHKPEIAIKLNNNIGQIIDFIEERKRADNASTENNKTNLRFMDTFSKKPKNK